MFPIYEWHVVFVNEKMGFRKTIHTEAIHYGLAVANAEKALSAAYDVGEFVVIELVRGRSTGRKAA